MDKNSLDTVLQKLNDGDPDAARQVFLAYEPYLRMVVRRQLSGSLRAKFDSTDVIQSVWADLLKGFRENKWSFTSPSHLRAFLVTVTRNRIVDRFRHHAALSKRETPLGDDGLDLLATSDTARPSAVAEAEDLWEQILAACPPAHVEILRMKRHGCTLNEIAAQTGFHKSSVRRIIYDLARRLAADRVDPDF